MVKRWAMRFLMILVFPLWNLIMLPFAVLFALHDGFFENMTKLGITPNEFVRGWKRWGKPQKESTDAD